jgi:drug/metabolite transporter (DMT)-like permease
MKPASQLEIPAPTARSLHGLGVVSGLAAGAWLGAAEAPTKLVATGLSPFLVSFVMVAGVFVARWTLPTVVKGTGYVLADLGEKPHLIVWAILAGALWAVANTLTVFAIRDVGISIAFPLWNTNSLVGVLWGWAFFGELRRGGAKTWTKVLGGAIAIAGGAVLLGYASANETVSPSHRALSGMIAALGAGLLWGTMYIPYRKAYVSGMNPLSFVTVFTIGELATMSVLAVTFSGGAGPLRAEIVQARPVLFWLFLGGFCWVIGDIFQQYAAKYIGIGRGIPLSNTNQLWGLAWGALVFGELAGRTRFAQTLVVAGSLLMILGAVGIASAVAPEAEQTSWHEAVVRECCRYGLDLGRAESAQRGEEARDAGASGSRRWWDGLIVAAAAAVFAALARGTQVPRIRVERGWMLALVAAMLALLFIAGAGLWKRTRFS